MFNARQSGIDPALIHAGGRFGALLFETKSILPFGLSGQYDSNHPDHDSCCPIAAEILVGYRQMKALIEAVNAFD